MNLTKHWAATLDDYAIDLAWSPDGALLAAASAAGPVSLFAGDTGAKHHTLPGHVGGTNTLAWMPPCQTTGPTTPATVASPAPLLATGGQDGAVKFWDAAAGQHTATAALGRTWVEHLAWRPYGQNPKSKIQNPNLAPVLFAAAGKNLSALRADGTVAHTFKPAPKTIIALAAQPAGGCVAAAQFGGVQLWDADDFLLQKELPYANGIHALVWSPDSKWLVSGNQDPSVHLWLPADNIELHMSGYEGKVKELSFDHTSRWLASGGGRDACIWDCSGAGPEGREPLMLPHDEKVCAVAFQTTHSLLATAAGDGTVMIWSVDRRQPLRATVKMPAAATKLAWSPDDALLAIGAENGAIYVLRCVA